MLRRYVIMLLIWYLNKNGYYVIHKLQYHTDRCDQYNFSRGQTKHWLMPNVREMYSDIVNNGTKYTNDDIESAILKDEEYYV